MPPGEAIPVFTESGVKSRDGVCFYERIEHLVVPTGTDGDYCSSPAGFDLHCLALVELNDP